MMEDGYSCRRGIYCRRFGHFTKRRVADAVEIKGPLKISDTPHPKKEAGKTGLGCVWLVNTYQWLDQKSTIHCLCGWCRFPSFLTPNIGILVTWGGIQCP